MADFDDDTTPLPPPPPQVRDPLFPTGRMPRIARGAQSPHEANGATTKMWSVLRQADTTRMSAKEIAAAIPLMAPQDDPMRTMRVDSAVFRPVEPPPWGARLRPFAIPTLAFAAGLALGILL